MQAAVLDQVADALTTPIYLHTGSHSNAAPVIATTTESLQDDIAALLLPQHALLVSVQIGTSDVLFWLPRRDNVDTAQPSAYVAHSRFNALSSLFPPHTLLRGLLIPQPSGQDTHLALFDMLQLGSNTQQHMSAIDRHVAMRTVLGCKADGTSDRTSVAVSAHWVGYLASCREHKAGAPWPLAGVAVLTTDGVLVLSE